MPKKEREVLKIGEVAALLGIKPYVIRYWETEFPHIAPKRTRSKQRLYTKEMVAQIRTIQYLLHEQGLTIEGARKALREKEIPDGTGNACVLPSKDENTLLIAELEALRALLVEK